MSVETNTQTCYCGLSVFCLPRCPHYGKTSQGLTPLQPPAPSAIDHPPHYGGKDSFYEVIKVIFAWQLHTNFPLANAIKYIARAGKKPGETALSDLKKARWYLNWEIERHETSLQKGPPISRG